MQIKELRPYVYVYCQNPDIKRKRLTEMFGNVLSSGEVVMLENKGREGKYFAALKQHPSLACLFHRSMLIVTSFSLKTSSATGHDFQHEVSCLQGLRSASFDEGTSG